MSFSRECWGRTTGAKSVGAERGGGVRSELTWPTIPAMLRDAARQHGAAEAVVDAGRRVDFATLAAMVGTAARALVGSGVEPGDRVAVWAPNSLEWIVAALAITTAGGV